MWFLVNTMTSSSLSLSHSHKHTYNTHIKGSLIYSVCCIHGEPLGFGRIPKEVASTKAVEYRTVSGRVVYYGRILYHNNNFSILNLDNHNSSLNYPWVMTPLSDTIG